LRPVRSVLSDEKKLSIAALSQTLPEETVTAEYVKRPLANIGAFCYLPGTGDMNRRLDGKFSVET
jgi:hypothetical protein